MDLRDVEAAEVAHTALLALGGRPSRPVIQHSTASEPNNTCQTWFHQSGQGAQLRRELDLWKMFLEYQSRIRKDAASFRRERARINAYWDERVLRRDLRPQLQEVQEQSKLEQWKEYYFFQHLQLGEKQARIERTRQQIYIGTDSRSTAQAAAEEMERVTKAAVNDRDVWADWVHWIESQASVISTEIGESEAIDRNLPSHVHLPPLRRSSRCQGNDRISRRDRLSRRPLGITKRSRLNTRDGSKRQRLIAQGVCDQEKPNINHRRPVRFVSATLDGNVISRSETKKIQSPGKVLRKPVVQEVTLRRSERIAQQTRAAN